MQISPYSKSIALSAIDRPPGRWRNHTRSWESACVSKETILRYKASLPLYCGRRTRIHLCSSLWNKDVPRTAHSSTHCEWGFRCSIAFTEEFQDAAAKCATGMECKAWKSYASLKIQVCRRGRFPMRLCALSVHHHNMCLHPRDAYTPIVVSMTTHSRRNPDVICMIYRYPRVISQRARARAGASVLRRGSACCAVDRDARASFFVAIFLSPFLPSERIFPFGLPRIQRVYFLRKQNIGLQTRFSWYQTDVR